MSDPIFERYKEALRAGHVAALRGRLDDALINYRQAAAIADERALPHASMAGVLLRLGRVEEAAAAYARAVERAPDDEAALSGRAETLIAAGKPAEAAQALDRLAEVFEAAEKPAEALTALHRAFDLVQTGKRRNRVKGLQQAVRAQLEAAAAAPPLLPEGGPDANTAAEEPEPVRPAAPFAGEAPAGTVAGADEDRRPVGSDGAVGREPVQADDPAVTTAAAGVSPAPSKRDAIAWPESDRRPAAGKAVADLRESERGQATSEPMAGGHEPPQAEPPRPSALPLDRLDAPVSAAPTIADGRRPGEAAGDDGGFERGDSVAAAYAGVPPLTGTSERPPATPDVEPVPGEGAPAEPGRPAVEWPAADLAQPHAIRRPATPSGAGVAAGAAGSAAGGAGGRETGSHPAREGEPGRGGSSIGRVGRPAEELIGVERVPALGSEPEQRFQAAEHAEATGARETAVWMYVQAADGFAARDGSVAALDACHRALAVSPRSAEAHLALVRLYVARGWRERAAEKLLLLDRLLELDHATADRERVAAIAVDMFPGDLRFPRTPPVL